jgi:hypothetical protein
VVTDLGDYASAKAAQFACNALPSYKIRHIVQGDPDGDCVKGWNVAAHYSKGEIIVQVSDDFAPPFNWDSLLLNLTCSHGGKWWEHDHAVHVNDAFVIKVMTSAVITRVRYLRYGYFYYPKYKSMFADTELTEVAYRDGVVIDARHLVFEHFHYNRNVRTCDAVDEKHGSKERWTIAEALFNSRKAANFPDDASQPINPAM